MRDTMIRVISLISVHGAGDAAAAAAAADIAHTWNDVFHWRGFYHSFPRAVVMLA